MTHAVIKSEYDANSAVTFLLLGLGIGTFLTILFNPKTKQRVEPEGINLRRTSGVHSHRAQSQEGAKERAA